MVKNLSEADAKSVLGVAGQNTRNGQIRADEFLPELRGKKAVRKYREMRDNDSTIGAVMYSVEQILRDVDLHVKPANDSDAAKREAKFVEEVLHDMDHTLDDHVAEALSFLSYGFAWFEVVYKRRVGPTAATETGRSKFTDGRMGVRKIAIRAPWTISKFDVEERSGDVLGIQQDVGGYNNDNRIPVNKSLYYRTTSLNGDPSGRSILRNAYTSYEYLNNLQSIEAIAVERELAGIPVARIPSEYLSGDASAAHQVSLTACNKSFGMSSSTSKGTSSFHLTLTQIKMVRQATFVLLT
jgi:Mu-like prophage protein gp29